MQTRIAASFQYSAAVWVLQLERAAKGQRPSQGGASLSPCPRLRPSTTVVFLWEACGQMEGVQEGGFLTEL